MLERMAALTNLRLPEGPNGRMLKFKRITIAMMMIRFTYSIKQGIMWDLLSWTVIKPAAGKT
jgi:hypothetical protein